MNNDGIERLHWATFITLLFWGRGTKYYILSFISQDKKNMALTCLEISLPAEQLRNNNVVAGL